MKSNKKAQSLSLNTIIIVILVLLVLVVVGYFFIKGSGGLGDSMESCLAKGGVCENPCSLGREVYRAAPGEPMVTCPNARQCCVYIN